MKCLHHFHADPACAYCDMQLDAGGHLQNELDRKAVAYAFEETPDMLSAYCELAAKLLSIKAPELPTGLYVDQVDAFYAGEAASFEVCLAANGYSTVWHDGFRIYKDLSNEALEAILGAH